MSQVPDYTHIVSLRLSQVLDEIGVNENIVLKTRRLGLLNESIHTITQQLTDNNVSVYLLGSQTESTTTLGLDSDQDSLLCQNDINVIQDWSEWEPGVRNYLMIQDETVSPGYCLLQRLYDDAPLPINDVLDEHHFRDRRGRILLKNTVIDAASNVVAGIVRHGPSQALEGPPGFKDSDFVLAFPCKSWPIQANHWLDQQGVGGWPSEEMRRYCSSTGCFVVAVGSKGSENGELEWRISTSLAERCLMFNLNITQIRCYVLLKMILKKFINTRYPDSISSFMCKTVLFHCIANTQANAWRENRLLTCLTFCLSTLYSFVLNEVCPHFIISENNLMKGHFSRETKPFILEILQYVVNSNGRALLEIECDELGLRLESKLMGVCGRGSQIISIDISGQLLRQTVRTTCDINNFLLSQTHDSSNMPAVLQRLSTYMKRLANQYFSNQREANTACSLISQQLCKSLGSILASSDINIYNNISIQALTWLSFGLDSDVSSSKLKLASIFYCVADTERTEMILRNTEERYDLRVVEPICSCYGFKNRDTKRAFNQIHFQQKQDLRLVSHTTATCVIFLPCEINCCPHELQHEMFRSTQEDKLYRGINDFWMDWAVVDSLPYLYFLQYKTYSHLRRQEEKQRALSNLVRTIGEASNFGHRETALNLLGQCMEQENRRADAIKCYLLSLQIRGRNNAAKFHICRLLSIMLHH